MIPFSQLPTTFRAYHLIGVWGAAIGPQPVTPSGQGHRVMAQLIGR